MHEPFCFNFHLMVCLWRIQGSKNGLGNPSFIMPFYVAQGSKINCRLGRAFIVKHDAETKFATWEALLGTFY